MISRRYITKTLTVFNNNNHNFRSRSQTYKVFSQKFLQNSSNKIHFSWSIHLPEAFLSKFEGEFERNCACFVHNWSLKASMAMSNSVGFKSNWASISLPIIHTSIIEELLSTTRPWITRIPILFFKRSWIESPNFEIYYAIVVDLFMLSILSFEPWDFVQNWMRYDCLKFWWWKLFPSIHAYLDVSWWNICGFVLYVEGSTQWYAWFWFLDTLNFSGNFQMKIFMIFIVFILSPVFLRI